MTEPEATPDDPKTPYFDGRKGGKFAKDGKIKIFAKVPFKDAEGDHKEGTEISMPYETPEQQSEVDTMIRYGVLSKTKPTED